MSPGLWRPDRRRRYDPYEVLKVTGLDPTTGREGEVPAAAFEMFEAGSSDGDGRFEDQTRRLYDFAHHLCPQRGWYLLAGSHGVREIARSRHK